TSTPFPDLLTQRITTPLGLRRTWHPAADPAEPGLPPLALHARRNAVAVDGFIRSSNDLYSTTQDLLTFERALLTEQPFADPATARLLTERSNRLTHAPVLRYGLGTMVFTINRLASPRRMPVRIVGHSGSTGTWLFTCPELNVQLAGTVDQTHAQGLPFRIMAACLRIWAG